MRQQIMVKVEHLNKWREQGWTDFVRAITDY